MILFLNAPARHLKTSVEIDVNMMLTQTYYHPQRLRMKALEEKRIDFFASVPKSKIRTGLEKVKVKNNTFDVIKEDRQTFGILVGKVQTPSVALKYPLTIVVLALTKPDQTLPQLSTKATLRRLLYEKSD